jgi:hypothetical protein
MTASLPLCLLTSAIVIISTVESHSAQCNLSGKQVTTQYTVCGYPNPNYPGGCIETRQRFSILGDKVLHSTDEISDEGFVYQIGKTLNPMQDPVQAKAFRGNLLDKFPAGTYVEAETTASYSVNQLRLYWSRSMFLRGGQRITKNEEIYIFEIADDCRSCQLNQTRYISTSDRRPTDTFQTKLTKQSCEIRSVR